MFLPRKYLSPIFETKEVLVALFKNPRKVHIPLFQNPKNVFNPSLSKPKQVSIPPLLTRPGYSIHFAPLFNEKKTCPLFKLMPPLFQKSKKSLLPFLKSKKGHAPTFQLQKKSPPPLNTMWVSVFLRAFLFQKKLIAPLLREQLWYIWCLS